MKKIKSPEIIYSYFSLARLRYRGLYDSKTLTLAVPVIISQVGQMVMGIVDTMMVGKLGPEYIGGVGIGAAVFSALSVLGLGLILGLDFLVAHAYGRKQIDECGYWLIQSVYLSVLASLPLTGLGIFLSSHLEIFKINPLVIVHAQNFLSIFIWSLPALLVYFCFRTYLQSLNHVKVVTALIISGNFLNAFLDWIFIYGKFGTSPLGAAGPGYATFITRILLLISIVAYTLWLNNTKKWGLELLSLQIKLNGIKRLLVLGVPAGLQLFFEVTVFALSTLFAGRLDPSSLAAHSIVLNIASLTFMVPLGLGSATSVRVGQFNGSGHREQAVLVGGTSLSMAVIFMSCSGLALYFFSFHVLKFFTSSQEVIGIGKQLLLIAALFQIADGLQTVGTGALRGLGNTVSGLKANLIGHWALGLPIGYYLCFYTDLKVKGLWLGLTTGLCSVAFLVVRSWKQEVTKYNLVVPGLGGPKRN